MRYLVVQAQLPGASAEAVESNIAVPTENSVAMDSVVHELRSRSADGLYRLEIAVKPGTQPQQFAALSTKVRAALAKSGLKIDSLVIGPSARGSIP
jgi:multidrug efflux pump subunit AcrB